MMGHPLRSRQRRLRVNPSNWGFSTPSIHLHRRQGGRPTLNLVIRLERNRISSIAVPGEVTFVAFRKGRTNFANGLAQGRDLQFHSEPWPMSTTALPNRELATTLINGDLNGC